MTKPRCRFLGHHSGGSWSSVAEGADDPYNYEYCMKMGWSGGDEEQEDGTGVCDTCKFYEPDENDVSLEPDKPSSHSKTGAWR